MNYQYLQLMVENDARAVDFLIALAARSSPEFISDTYPVVTMFADNICDGRADEMAAEAIMMAMHQIRFLILHELAHIVGSHMDMPYSKLRTPRWTVVPLETDPPLSIDMLETLQIGISEQQAQEVEADRWAFANGIRKDDEVMFHLQRYMQESRQPELAQWVILDQLFCSRSEEFFVNAIDVMFFFFCLRERFHGSAEPDSLQTHPWPQLRIHFLQKDFVSYELEPSFVPAVKTRYGHMINKKAEILLSKLMK